MTLGDGALWLVVALVVVVGGTVAALQAAADRRRREALLLWSADRSVPAWVRREHGWDPEGRPGPPAPEA